MSTKRKRKRKTHSGNNDLALSYRIERTPRGRISKKEFFTRVIRYLKYGDNWPRGLDVTLRWKNSLKGKWREAELREAVNDSREGFVSLVTGRFERDAGFVVAQRKHKKRMSSRKSRKGRKSLPKRRKHGSTARRGKKNAKSARSRHAHRVSRKSRSKSSTATKRKRTKHPR